MLKRLPAYASVALLSLVVLAACGGGGGGQTPTTSAQPADRDERRGRRRRKPPASPARAATPKASPAATGGSPAAGRRRRPRLRIRGGRRWRVDGHLGRHRLRAGDNFTIPADTEVTVTLPNEGALPHNFSIDALSVSVDLPPARPRSGLTAGRGVRVLLQHARAQEAGMVGTMTAE